MKRKALFCALLVLTLLAALSQPASALLSNERSTVIEGVARLPVISVRVPGNVNILINPYEMPVTIGDGIYTDQIVCNPAYIVSYSDIPLRVDVSITGSVYPDSDMTLVSSPTNGAGTDKRVFAYFEMQTADWDFPYYIQWDQSYNPAKHIVVANGETKTKQNIVTLPPLPQNYDLYGLLAEDAYAWFRLTGDAARNPNSEWNTRDGIKVTVAFTFTPISYITD